ncbi:MAG: hypothetical protein LBT80_06590 [Lactobacillaceae bacterium]|jgi:hypothetical protein|nr:hypothetical protein [Lactobacillaceae bacterium]
MGTKGSIKHNDFSRGAAPKGVVTSEEKKAAKLALLAAAKAKLQTK